MNDALWQRWRWTAACGAAVLLAFVALLAHDALWETLGVYHMRPYFADLAAVFAAGQAQGAGLDVYQPNPFDPFHRPHVYGPLWLVTGSLGLTVGDALWAGPLLGLAFLAAALVLLAPRSPAAAAVAALLLLSPPVLLGLERANNDLVIFLLLAAGTAATARSRVAQAAGAGAVVLAAVLKYYPLVALPALAARGGRLRGIVGAGAAGAGLFGILWWLQREEFTRALAISPSPATIFAYGYALLPHAWEVFADVRFWHLLGFALGATALLVALGPDRRRLWEGLPLHGARTFAVVAGGATWSFCYFANSNFAYRAVLLLLVVPCWLEWSERRDDRTLARTGRRLCALLLGALWLAAPKYWWATLHSDGGGTVAHARCWLAGLVGLEQALWLGLTLAVGATLAGWAWRRLKEGPW